MKSLYEERGGTYTLGEDGMYYPDLSVDDNDRRPIGRWGRMHQKYLETGHSSLYEQLILNGTLHQHLADANERAEAMLSMLTEQMATREHITKRLKAEQPMVWIGKMNSIKSRAEEMICNEIINTL